MYPTQSTTPDHTQWDGQHHPDGTGSTQQQNRAETARHQREDAFSGGYGTWVDVLDEAVQAAFAEADPMFLRAELERVAAVCAAWVSDLDRRPTSPTAPCTCARSWGLHSRDCARYVEGHELINPASRVRPDGL